MALLCRARRAFWRSSGSIFFLLDDQLGSALGKLLDNIVLVVLLGQHQRFLLGALVLGQVDL
mgnify:CR=1 FL=1